MVIKLFGMQFLWSNEQINLLYAYILRVQMFDVYKTFENVLLMSIYDCD